MALEQLANHSGKCRWISSQSEAREGLCDQSTEFSSCEEEDGWSGPHNFCGQNANQQSENNKKLKQGIFHTQATQSPISLICRGIIQIDKKKMIDPMKKWAKDVNRLFTEREGPVAPNPVKTVALILN